MSGIAFMRDLARSDVIRELAMTGVFSGSEALTCGFATSLHADPLAAARLTAKEIAARSPHAVRAIKRLLNEASDANTAAVLIAESKEQAALIGSAKQIEAVRAGVERRPGGLRKGADRSHCGARRAERPHQGRAASASSGAPLPFSGLAGSHA
jgi:enoyl-CoA hydratase/carnithine racemase